MILKIINLIKMFINNLVNQKITKKNKILKFQNMKKIIRSNLKEEHSLIKSEFNK